MPQSRMPTVVAAGPLMRVSLELHANSRTEIAVIAIDEALEQGRADGHRKAAVHLPVEQSRVQDAAGIVERHVFVDPHLSGGTINFDAAKIKDKAISRRAVDLVHLVGRCQAWRGPEHRFAQGD